MHLHAIGQGLVDQITTLISSVSAAENQNATISREYMRPSISFNKRRGVAKDEMEIEEGITIYPGKPVVLPGTNEREDIGYTYVVSIAQGSLTEDIDKDWRVGIWEQAIRQRFSHRRLGVELRSACELSCICKPGDLPNWAMIPDGIDASFLEITCFVRESRRDD